MGASTTPAFTRRGRAGCASGCVTPFSSESGSPRATRFPSSSIQTHVRLSSRAGNVRSASGKSTAKSVSIQRVCTEKGAVMKSGSCRAARWKGRTLASPSILNSARARRARASAISRDGAQTISFASRESKVGGTVEPVRTPLSRRIPMPDGGEKSLIVPETGRNPRAGSSALIRNSKAWPCGGGVSVLSSRLPRAISSWAMTRSMPVFSSVTVCSTCRRVLTSRKENSPSGLSRNSTVPAPQYAASRHNSLAAS